MTTRKGWAVWKGGIKDGSGTISTETGVLHDVPYGFASRFENGKGTNPEELIAAAHAACFSMALSLMLGQAGMTRARRRFLRCLAPMMSRSHRGALPWWSSSYR